MRTVGELRRIERSISFWQLGRALQIRSTIRHCWTPHAPLRLHEIDFAHAAFFHHETAECGSTQSIVSPIEQDAFPTPDTRSVRSLDEQNNVSLIDFLFLHVDIALCIRCRCETNEGIGNSWICPTT